MQSVSSNAVYNKVDSMLKYYTANVGTYTVGAGQTLSLNMNSFVKPKPYGYTRLSFLYSIGQNYFNCDVNFAGANNVAYATVRNNYTLSLTSTFYLYQIFIPQSQMIT